MSPSAYIPLDARIYGPLGVLFLALIFPQLSFVQTILLLPIFVCAVGGSGIAAITYFAVREELKSTAPDTLAYQRHALPKLAFTTSSAWSAVLTRRSWEESPSPSSRTPIRSMSSPGLIERLNTLFDLIKIHFILPWHDRISPSPAFPNAVELLIRQSMSKVIERGEGVDWPDLIVARIVPRLTDHLEHFRSIEHFSSTSAAPANHTSLPLPLPRKAHPALADAAHARAAGLSPNIEAHLRSLVKRLLLHVLPEPEQTEVVSTVVTEVVLGSVLLPVFEMLCDSDFWNRQIDDKGGKHLREQKQVNKFLSALANLQQPLVAPSPIRPGTLSSPRAPSSTSLISVHSSSKQFDTFIRSIAKVKTLGEARRLRADVERELRQSTGMDPDQGDEREKAKRVKYMQRLERAKRHIDNRIATLSGQDMPSSIISPRIPDSNLSPGSTLRTDLHAVLGDPSSMAYFLEFMERRSRSRLVQFWLTVEGFKDPLEAASRESAVDITSQPLPDEARASDNTTISEDVSFLYLAYIASDDTGSFLHIPDRHRSVIKGFAEKLAPAHSISVKEVRNTKHAMFSAQASVYEQMQEDDWPAFQRSELYLKAVSNLVSESTRNSGAMPRQSSPIKASLMTPSQPAPVPLRQNTAPALLLTRTPLSTPAQRPPPRLVNGSFASSSVALAPALGFTLPQTNDLGPDGAPSARKQIAQGPSGPPGPRSHFTPVALTRGSSHFDVLMSDELPVERDPLFDDQADPDDDQEDYMQTQRMEAIQAALNEIIASDDMTSSRMSESQTIQPESPGIGGLASPSASVISLGPRPAIQRDHLMSRSVDDLKKTSLAPRFVSAPHSRHTSGKAGELPSLAEINNLSDLSPSNERPSKHLFDDDLPGDDEDNFDKVHKIEDEGASCENALGDVVQLAEPGNLYLGAEIGRLQEKLQELVKQEHLLETLIRQAELTGNQAELRILNRSISSIRRETRTCIFQKAQYEQQEEENRLIPGKTRVTIPRHIDTSEDGKQVVRYVVRVQQLCDAGEGPDKSTLYWDVARRYNDFHELDKGIKDWAVSSSDKSLLQDVKKRIPELPGKKIAPILSGAQLDSRRSGLERYLQALVISPVICDSVVFRSFLSRSPGGSPSALADSTASIASLSSLAPHNLVRSLYKTMATSLDDAMFGPSMLDLMYTSLSRQISDVTGLVGMGSDDLVNLLPQALKSGWLKDADVPNPPTHTLPESSEEIAASIFTSPICDLCIELFDLKENKNNWLRRQAILVIIQQFLGNTIERKARDTFRNSHQPESIEKALSGLTDLLFPDGVRRPPSEPRTDKERHETKVRASKQLGLLMPDVVANMIGRSNARRAARRVFSALQDTRLNQQLILCILDDIFDVLFPRR